MTSPVTPQPCFICRRRDDGCALLKGREIRWYCAECGTALAKRANRMMPRAFDLVEQRAMQEAGDQAGAYLDELGKTDLAQLDPNEWNVFLITIIRKFGEAMRREVAAETPPF